MARQNRGGAALVVLPFATFGEIAALGLKVEVHCLGCHRVTRFDPSDVRLRDRCFAGARFRCTGTRDIGFAHPPRPGLSTGYVSIEPPDHERIGPTQSIAYADISCPRCVPSWQISQAPRDRPPWAQIWVQRGVRLACPACRSVLSTVWHGGDGVPYTDGFERRRTSWCRRNGQAPAGPIGEEGQHDPEWPASSGFRRNGL